MTPQKRTLQGYRSGALSRHDGIMILSAAALAAAVLFAGLPAKAETLDEFANRIGAAYRAADKDAALKALFYLDGVDPDTMKMYEQRTIKRMLGRYDSPAITFEPVPAGNDFTYVAQGYEYRPNLKIVGYAVLNGKTKAPYGIRGDRHYFIGVLRTKIEPPPPPDTLLQMMVIGMGSPPVTFTGYCNVLQGNGKLRRMELEDSGRGNTTSAIMAQSIEQCELTNTSGRGALSLRLSEGETEIFKQRVEAPDATITYRRQ